MKIAILIAAVVAVAMSATALGLVLSSGHAHHPPANKGFVAPATPLSGSLYLQNGASLCTAGTPGCPHH